MTRLMLLLALLVPAPLFAHHGKDFLVVETYAHPHPGTVYAVTAEQFVFADSEVMFHDEPSVMFGIVPGVATEIHAHVMREPGERARLVAIAPALHVHLFDTASLHGAVSGEWEIGRNGEGNTVTGRFVLGRSFGAGVVVANVGVTRSHMDGTSGIYALGYRPDLQAARSWGLEAQGTLESGATHEILGAGYFQLGSRLTFRAGAGALVGNGTPAKVLRTGFVWRF